MAKAYRVKKITGSRVTLQEEKPGCFGCMNQDCRSRQGIFEAANLQNLPLERGQLVEVAVSRGSVAAQTLTALLPPALGGAAGFALVRWLFPLGGDGSRALGAAAGFLLAALSVYRLRRPALPRITRVLG